MIVKMIRASWSNGMPLPKGEKFNLIDENAKMLIHLGHAEEATGTASNQSQKQRTMPQAVAA